MRSTLLWNPIEELAHFQRQFENTFGGAPAHRRCGAPEAQVSRDEENYYAELVVPGVDPKSLQVQMEADVLRISGTRVASAADGQEAQWHVNERPTGEFIHRLRLPKDVDGEQVAADYRHGILLVTIPKAEAAKPRSIEVKVQ
jgi:HSP20 family protein